MLHARKDYNERIQDSQNLIPSEEPVFLLRGQDQTAAAAVRAYAYIHRTNGGSDTVYLAAMRQADRMEAWAKEKTSKLADVDPSLCL